MGEEVLSEVKSPEEILDAAGFSLLDKETPPKMLEGMLRELSKKVGNCDEITRVLVREEVVKVMGTAGVKGGATRLADAALGRRSHDGPASDDRQGRSVVLKEAEPWPEPVNASSLLADICKVIRRYVVLPIGGEVAIALWVLHSYLVERLWITPRLLITSPTKRCGKTTVIECLLYLVPRPLSTANVTAAAIFRTVEKYAPVLLIDEGDTFLQGSSDLKGILNSGHCKATAQVVRTAGEDFEPRIFSTFGAVGIGMIGEPADTILDRSVVLRMRRKTKEEKVAHFRSEHVAKELEPLRQKAARWAKDNGGKAATSEPEIPSELNDRQADNWRILLAIADLAGESWPEKAREAALALSGAVSEEDNAAGVQLLADIRGLFDKKATERLASTEIVEALVAMEERPWPEWQRGQPITKRQVARLLKPFDIKPKQVWTDGENTRGYDRADLEDAFSRYIPPSEVLGPLGVNNDKGLSPVSEPLGPLSPNGSKNARNPYEQGVLTDLTDGEGGLGDQGGSVDLSAKSWEEEKQAQRIGAERPSDRPDTILDRTDCDDSKEDQDWEEWPI